jgi:hypothetical protein
MLTRSFRPARNSHVEHYHPVPARRRIDHRSVDRGEEPGARLEVVRDHGDSLDYLGHIG